MADNEINVEYDTNGVPLPTERDGNGYSTELSRYLYPKLESILNNNEFSNDEITKYNLDESNGKINISTTRKLINYLKSFSKSYTDKSIENINDDVEGMVDESEYNTKMESIEQEFESIEGELNRLNSLINKVNNEIIDKVYPVGSIYISFQSTNPSELFEGTSWLKLEDRFLLGSGSKSLTSTGGEEKHTLTVNEMPLHNHTQESHSHNQVDYQGNRMSYLTATYDSNAIKIATIGRSFSKLSSGDGFIVYTSGDATIVRRQYTNVSEPTIYNTGGNAPHENMPPYLVVNMWRRVS